MILLVSPEGVLVEEITAELPDITSLVHLTSSAEAESYLQTQREDEPAVSLILFYAEDSSAIADGCRQFCSYLENSHIPLIALLVRHEDRQVALEAGSADYMLLPLLSVEIKTKLELYFYSSLRVFDSMMTVIEALEHSATVSPRVWTYDLKKLSGLLTANAAWVFLATPDKKNLILTAGYNFPPNFINIKSNRVQKIADFWRNLPKSKSSSTGVIGPYPVWDSYHNDDVNDLPHHLIIPLCNRRVLYGALTLAYKTPPRITQYRRHNLTILGHNLGVLLEMKYTQEEIQLYAAQNAFIVLIARTISERLDLNSILSQTLEQVVPLFNASGGDIWLLSDNKSWLELASSLTPPTMRQQQQLFRRAKGQGLIGWVIDKGDSLYVPVANKDTRFNPQMDYFNNITTYSLLAVPLRHRDKIIGALVIYHQNEDAFLDKDILQLEGIASLTASAIANARLLQELQENADQRLALYEMSQNIAAGLDLDVTLNRTLHWVGRLFGIEGGLLWLVEDAAQSLHLACTMGMKIPQEEKIEIAIGHGLFGWVARTGESAIVNRPYEDSRMNKALLNTLKINPRNIIAAPMTYHGKSIGVLALINKNNGEFDETDLTLLSTALEIIAVAVGNARLHTQTVALMKEKERLHKQILQGERLTTIGRLTGSLSHEINNPMQAIQGALALALEELDNPEELAAYIKMSMQESERVVKLLNRMRQIYRPQSDILESLDLNYVLQEASDLARKELRRQKIILKLDLMPKLPRLTAIANQLHLVFLSLLLNLSDTLSNAGGGTLLLRSYAIPQAVRVELSTDVAIVSKADWMAAFKSSTPNKEAELSFGLSLSHDIISTHNGTIDLNQQDGQTVCIVELPVSVSKSE